MNDPEIIKLKKEIHHLKGQYADLQSELEDKNNRLGQIETEYLKMKNETMYIARNQLMKQQDIIKENIDKAIEERNNQFQILEQQISEYRAKNQVIY